jgi:hypothetical protein
MKTVLRILKSLEQKGVNQDGINAKQAEMIERQADMTERLQEMRMIVEDIRSNQEEMFTNQEEILHKQHALLAKFSEIFRRNEDVLRKTETAVHRTYDISTELEEFSARHQSFQSRFDDLRGRIMSIPIFQPPPTRNLRLMTASNTRVSSTKAGPSTTIDLTEIAEEKDTAGAATATGSASASEGGHDTAPATLSTERDTAVPDPAGNTATDASTSTMMVGTENMAEGLNDVMKEDATGPKMPTATGQASGTVAAPGVAVTTPTPLHSQDEPKETTSLIPPSNLHPPEPSPTPLLSPPQNHDKTTKAKGTRGRGRTPPIGTRRSPRLKSRTPVPDVDPSPNVPSKRPSDDDDGGDLKRLKLMPS